MLARPPHGSASCGCGHPTAVQDTSTQSPRTLPNPKSLRREWLLAPYPKVLIEQQMPTGGFSPSFPPLVGNSPRAAEPGGAAGDDG